ncbi:MAG: glycosyltransferase [Deltaproteobacteria bacterium]|nr:glycosyltransferase [Deltaproteobacteria bacterium]
MNTSSTLSLCMIVKDEESMLSRCLKSAGDYADEIIIVDTGSTDQTVEIARKFGARVYHHPWENDFAKHRNQAISYATCDWILMIDADEELMAGSGNILKKAINKNNIDSIVITNISTFNNGRSEAWNRQTRIFKNLPYISYSDIVHEQLTGINNSKYYPIFFYHRGYDLKKEVTEKKHIRNISLIKEQIKRDPNNYFFHLNLAVTYSIHLEYEKAVEHGITALCLAREQKIAGDNVLWIYYIISSAYLKLDDLDNAEKYATEGANLSQEHLDSRFILMVVSHRKKDWKRLAQVSTELLELFSLLDTSPEKFNSRLIHMTNEEWRVHIALGDMYLHKQRKTEAEQSFKNAESMAANLSECEQIIGDCYRSLGMVQQAEDHYRASMADKSDNSRAIWGLALVKKSQNAFEEYKDLIDSIDVKGINNHDIIFEKGLIALKGGDYSDATAHFNRAIELKPDSFHSYQNLGLSYKGSGDFPNAISSNIKALELRPESTDVRINLGHILYEIGEFDHAKMLIESILEIDSDHVDIQLLLCDILLTNNNMKECVHQCDSILKNLDIPFGLEVTDPSDLADLFILISQTLAGRGNTTLSKMASSIAHRLDPEIKGDKIILSGTHIEH